MRHHYTESDAADFLSLAAYAVGAMILAALAAFPF